MSIEQLLNTSFKQRQALEEKNKVERQKLLLDTQKVQTERIKAKAEYDKAQVANAKTAAETQKLKTEDLGLQQQNIANKLQTLKMEFEPEQLQGAVPHRPAFIPRYSAKVSKYGYSPVQQPQVKKPVQTPQMKPTVEPPSPPPKPSGVITSPKGFGFPARRTRLPEAPPVSKLPTPESIVRRQNEAFQNALEINKNLTQKKIEVQDMMAQAARDTRKEFFRINTERQRLVNDTPTYAKALSNVNWLQKIGAVVHAFNYGDLYQNGVTLLDKFVNQELNDLKAKHTSALEGLTASENLYEKMFKLTKDEAEAEWQTEVALWEGAMREIDIYGSQLKSQEQLAKLNNLKNAGRQKIAEIVAKSQAKIREKAIEKQIESIGAMQAPLLENVLGAEQISGLKPKEQTDRIVNFGKDRIAIISKDSAKKAGEEIQGGLDALGNTREVFTYLGELKRLTGGAFWKGPAAAATARWFPGKDDTQRKRVRSLYQRVNIALVNASLSRRIDLSGGGNMTERELDFILAMAAAVRQSGGSKQFMIQWLNQRSEDYDTIVGALKKASINTLVKASQRSHAFAKMNENQKIEFIARNANLSREEVLDMLQNQKTRGIYFAPAN